MSKKIVCLLVWLFVIQASAQNLSITNSSGPNSVSGCSPSTDFTLNVNNAPGSFNASDEVHLDFIFAQGIQLNQVTSNTGSVTINGNSVTINNLNGINTFEIHYSINLNCNFPSNNTVLNTHSVNYGLNANTPQTFNYNATYACTQSVLVFDGGTNLNFNNALLNTPFTRTYIFRNSSGVPFTGNFTFDDNAFYPANASYHFTDISLVPSANAGTLVASTTNLNAHIELQITGLAQGQSFTITETGQLLECSGAVDHSKTVFTAMYGCHANDQCRDVESSIPKEASARVSQEMPIVQFTNDQHLENCINSATHRTYTITNVGLGAANKASLMFSRGGVGPIVGASYFLDDIDQNSISATINGIPASTTYSTSASGYYVYILVNGNIEPGQSVVIEYDEVFNCIPEVSYNDYFNKTAILHNLHPLYVSLSHPCLGDNGTYAGLFYSHPQELKQTFTNLNGQMLGGPPSSAWFNIDNATPLVLGNFLTPFNNNPAGTYLVPYNLADAEFEVRLKLETGLRLTNNSDFYLTSLIGATTVTLNPLPGDVNNPNTGQGDIVIAKFHFPANWYDSNTYTYNGHTYWTTTTEFNQFFNSFKVNFQLEANCAYAPSNGVAHITEQCFINPTPACADCKLPLCQVSDFTNINCPGCVVPGWNITSFDIKRTTLGFADTDNNHLLDSQPPVVASINDVNTSAAMIGDTIEGTITGYLSDGQNLGVDSLPVGFTFDSAGFAYDEGLLNFSGTVIQHLEFVSATGTLTLSGGIQTTFAVTAADIFPQTNCIGIPMSIQDLIGYGAQGISTYSTITNIELHPRFKIIHNLTDGSGNPYYSTRAINCFYYISGSGFTDACSNLQDANYHIPELLAQPATRPDYQYWCTSYEGRFMGTGVDLRKTYLKAAENTRYNSIPSISLCSKSISYNYWVSVGKEYITDPQSGAMNQTSATIFNNEVRPIGTLDTLTFNYPADYEPAAITFHNFDAGYDASNNVHTWHYDVTHNFDYPVYYGNGTPTNSVSIGTNFITIYPSQFISTLPTQPPYGTQYYSAFEENQYYRVSIYLRPKDCSDLPELSDFNNNTTEAKFSNFPLNTVTQTTTSIESVDVSGLKNSLSFRNPNPVLSLTTPSGINPTNNLVSWDVALTSNAVDPSPNPLDEAIIRSAENTFVSFVSPSGNFSNMSIGGNVTTFLNASSAQAPPVMIPGWTTDFTNQSAGYNLDFVGYNYNEDQIISKQFKINADFNCANLTPGASDYITVYKGWNCFNAPNSVLSACKHDSVNLYFTVPQTELQVSFQNDTTVSACSTTSASITLDPTTGVTQSVLVELQSVPAGAYAYIPNSAYFTTDDGNGGTTTTYIEPVFSNGVWTWNLNSLGGNFSQAPVLYYQLQTSCGFESGQTTQHITAKNSCGLIIANLTHTWSPQVISNFPQPDVIEVSVNDITLTHCQNNFSVQLSITNAGTNPTAGHDHIIFPLPNGINYTGNNPDIGLVNNELHIEVPANINSGNNFIYTIPVSYAASTCTTIALTFSITHNVIYSCGNDTCAISSEATVIDSSMINVDLPVYTVSNINTGDLCNNGNTLYFSLNSTGATITDLTTVSIIDLSTGTILGSVNITLPFTTTEAMSVVLTGSSTNLGFVFSGCNCTNMIEYTYSCTPCNADAGTDVTICEDDTVTLNAGGVGTYLWTPGNFNTAGIDVSPPVTTTYTLIVTNGTVTCTDEVTVFVTPTPSLTVTANDSVICKKQSATLTATMDPDGGTYSWEPLPVSPSQDSPVITVNPTTTTIYTVTGTVSGCSSTSTISITVIDYPVLQVSPSDTICEGQNVILTASGASSYVWSPSSGLSNTVGAIVTASPIITTEYLVIGSNGDCSVSTSVIVVVNPLPVISVNSPTICAGQSTTLTANGASTYTWSPTSGLSSVNGSTVSTNPTADMTYTVTGTTINGCVDSAVSNITVYSLPTITVNSPTICAGESTTLTANGADTYSWSPTSGLSSITGYTVATSPTADMIYTVTGTSVNGCTATAVSHISVNPLPEIAITGQDSVCKGQNSTTLYANMTPSGGNFVWTIPPSNTPVGTTNELTTGLLGSTTVYALSATLNGCTTTTTYPVVVVGSINVSLTANASEICSGDSLILTAGGAGINGTYSWDPQPVSVGVNGSPATYIPLQTTTYTVTGINSIGCVDDNTITVTVRNCLCDGNEVPAIIGTNTQTNFSGAAFAINGNTIINANTLFQDASVVFTGDYTLYVNNGATLTLNHAHLWACETMWNGIKVLPGGRLIVIGNSLIEDADSAIYIKNPALSGGNTTVLEVNGATFNRNFTAITLDSYNANVSNYPFMIKDAVFTKRDIDFATIPPFTPAANPWPGISSYKAIVNAGTINEHCAISNYQSVALKAPHIADNSKYGIRINNVGNINTNWNGSNIIYNGILIGAIGTHGNTNMNLYDNLETGIYAMNSNFTNINSTFQYMVSVNDAPTIYDADGIGIFAFKAKGTDNMYKATIKEGTFFNAPFYINKFYDTRYGVLINNYAVTEITNSDVRSTQVNDLGNLGTIGFDVVSGKYKSIAITSNTITNVRYGIACTGHQSSVFGPVTIDNNVIQAHYPNLPFLSSQFVRQGIFALTFSVSPVVQSNTIVSTSNNILLDVDNGIVTREWKALKSVSNSNYIRMKYRSGVLPTQIGIEHSDNGSNEIINNTIEDDPGNSTLHIIDNYKGIFSRLCSNEAVTCNFITKLGTGIEFSYNHPGVNRFNNNTFNNNYKGYVLSNNASIGNQFNATSPSDNKWINFAQTNYHTFVNGSDPLLSKLYVRNNLTSYEPTQNGGNTPYALNASILHITNNPKELACKPAVPFDGARIAGCVNCGMTDQNQFNYLVYPNPAQNELSISTNNLDITEAQVDITDITGKHITSKKLYFENGLCRFTLNIENGAYLLNIQSDTGMKPSSYKLIIMK